MLVAYSRITQIMLNSKNKSMGVQSPLESIMKVGGNVARLFTSVVEVGDPMIILNLLVSTVLNATVLGQFLVYPSEKKVADTKQKKE